MADHTTPLLTTESNTASEASSSSKRTLIFNVGGVNFETYTSTLQRLPNSPLNNKSFLDDHFRPERNDHFVDKDPDAFKSLLNYLRTGQLHIPSDNSPSVRNDLLFWGMTPAEIGQADAVCNQVSQSGFANSVPPGTGTSGEPHTIWNLLSSPHTSKLAIVYAAITYVFICASIIILVFQSTERYRTGLDSKEHLAVDIVNILIQLFFLAEYILRVVFAPKKVAFIFSFLGVIDLLAVLPDLFLFVVSMVGHVGNLTSVSLLRVLIVFRILRILRVFRHFKNLTQTDVFTSALKSSAGELVLVASLFVIGVLVSATIVYTAEADSEYVYGFVTIPRACWWSVITMTTVGYGDVFPVTVTGKVTAALTALYGLTMIALLVCVLVSKFIICSNKKNQHGGRNRK